MHIFVKIRFMDLNIEKNETIKILRPGSYWQEFMVLDLTIIHRVQLKCTHRFLKFHVPLLTFVKMKKK